MDRMKRAGQATEVVAALIWKPSAEGKRMMICQRPEQKARGLLWEFVGGKVEPGETLQQALVRECREELAVTVSVGDVFMDVLHEYPDLTVHLTLFSATIAEGEPQLLEHRDIRWILPSEIPQYAFCPADETILKQILYTSAKETILPGRYRHFKGKEYEVIGIARHSETLEPLVVYRALYGNGELWTRPAEMWKETVLLEGKSVRRFERIEDENAGAGKIG